MKKLQLKTQNYNYLVASFKEWLDILGYAASTVYNLPNHLQEFFYYAEQQGHCTIDTISTKDVSDYYEILKRRSNERRCGGLSKSYLNKHQQALKKFREHLLQHHSTSPLRVHLKMESHPTEERINILTQSEIKELFAACHYSNKRKCICLRDRAILVVLYSCGLRRTEAVSLDIKDVFFDKQRIFVRKGKNYKQRFVPINTYNLKIIENYIFESRPEFINANQSEALFISIHGKRLEGMSFANRLKAIVKATENKTILAKQITLHTLRHSIATHLLEQNVPIESIKHFLGHSSLESTQIYVHLLKNKEDEL